MFKNSASIGLLLLALTACGTQNRYSGAQFINPARDISSAFLRPNGDLYLVPEKGVVIQEVLHPNGQSLSWKTDGSYVVLSGTSISGIELVNLQIAGKLRRQDTSTPQVSAKTF